MRTNNHCPFTIFKFIYLCIYQLFWTQACPEGMRTNGTYRSHAKTGKQKKSCNKLTTITAMNLTFSLPTRPKV